MGEPLSPKKLNAIRNWIDTQTETASIAHSQETRSTRSISFAPSTEDPSGREIPETKTRWVRSPPPESIEEARSERSALCSSEKASTAPSRANSIAASLRSQGSHLLYPPQPPSSPITQRNLTKKPSKRLPPRLQAALQAAQKTRAEEHTGGGSDLHTLQREAERSKPPPGAEGPKRAKNQPQVQRAAGTDNLAPRPSGDNKSQASSASRGIYGAGSLPGIPGFDRETPPVRFRL
uniref:Uncharacterized protein n=1 Tax=Eutreptiella gymnastica TaxID=73025 RepID=A0A7S1N3P3_9EUGL